MEGSQEFPSFIKDLDPLVVSITDDDIVVFVNCDTSQVHETSVSLASCAKCCDERSLVVKDLDPVVPTVSHDDPVFLVHCHTDGGIELALQFAL